MSKIFRFKQFSVDQTNCGMKVNTDAALLGAIAGNDEANRILEIGTGTGVIALMLAQRYTAAVIDAVEIDELTAQTAALNFSESPFSGKINIITSSFEDYLLTVPGKKYDLIVSNPPYFINALRSDDRVKGLARHTDDTFFKNLLSGAAQHLTGKGLLYLILPLDTAELVKSLALQQGGLSLRKTILIHSFPGSKPYRCILVLDLNGGVAETEKFVIYESQNVYTGAYRQLLKDYLTIF